jgi:hypothetical protein
VPSWAGDARLPTPLKTPLLAKKIGITRGYRVSPPLANKLLFLLGKSLLQPFDVLPAS